MAGLASNMRRLMVATALIAALVASLFVGYFASYSGGESGPSGGDVTFLTHKNPGKHKRCRPKGQYGKPETPVKCRRRPHGTGQGNPPN